MPEPVSESTATTGLADDTVAFYEDGQPITVAEARNGRMRQKDYTQKTQQLSALKRQAEQSMQIVSQMERNPKATLLALDEHFGAGAFGTAPAAARTEYPEDGDPVPEAAPTVPLNEVDDLRAQVAQMQQEQVTNQLRAELEAIQASDPHVDLELIVQKTRDEGFPNFNAAYKAMKWEQAQSGEPAAPATDPTETPSPTPQDSAVEDAKRETAGMVASGSGTPEGAVSEPMPGKFESPRDAVVATIRDLETKGLLVES